MDSISLWFKFSILDDFWTKFDEVVLITHGFFQALLSCPTGSIRTETPPTDIREAQETFPLALDQENLPVVSHPFRLSFFSYNDH